MSPDEAITYLGKDNLIVAREKIADLKVQSMMFDMEVDWETLKLVSKKKPYQEPFWITRWKEKRDNSDNLPESPEQAAWDDIHD